MARLYLWAEGHTEQTFADVLLKPHLANLGLYLSVILIQHSRKKGKIHRGGGRKYLAMKNGILNLLKQEKTHDVFFTTLIDLYAIPSEFPGLQEAERLRQVPLKRVEFLESAFGSDVGDRRFIPHIQLHEYEAFLFVDASQLGSFFPNVAKQIARLAAVAASYSTPELIDDGPQTAPSKRIIAEIPDYEHLKTVVGPQVAAAIGLAAIRGKCPHFAAWLSRLESLDKSSRPPP